jgi:hypothetical protein
VQGHLLAPALPAANIPKYLASTTPPVVRHSRR